MQDINQVRVYATHSEKVFALEETHIFLLPLFRLLKNDFDLFWKPLVNRLIVSVLLVSFCESFSVMSVRKSLVTSEE